LNADRLCMVTIERGLRVKRKQLWQRPKKMGLITASLLTSPRHTMESRLCVCVC
jgi:hypothetical protein